MSLGCARGCGDCCDPVFLSADQRDRMDYWRDVVEDFWNGCQPHPEGSLPFMLVHWHERERIDTGARYDCDRFDPVHRECTAHTDRPPVCSDYPWYDEEPGPARIGGRCSYLLDLPPDQRPEGARPLIPLTVLS